MWAKRVFSGAAQSFATSRSDTREADRAEADQRFRLSKNSCSRGSVQRYYNHYEDKMYSNFIEQPYSHAMSTSITSGLNPR